MWSLIDLKGGWRGWLRRWVRLIFFLLTLDFCHFTTFTCLPCTLHNLSMSKTAKFAPQIRMISIADLWRLWFVTFITLDSPPYLSYPFAQHLFAFMVGTMMTTTMSWKRDPLDEQLQTLSSPGFRSAHVNGSETGSPNILICNISSTCKSLTILCIWVYIHI